MKKVDLSVVLEHPTGCSVGVVRRTELVECGKPAIGVGVPYGGEGLAWPVCAWHARGPLTVPLAELLELVRSGD